MLSGWKPLRFLLLLLTLSPATQVLGFKFHLPKLGGCPDLAAQQNFLSNIDKSLACCLQFLGKWYVQSSFNTEFLQGKGRCVEVNFKYIPLNNDFLVQMGQFNEDNNAWERLDADAYPKNKTDDEGKFTAKLTVQYWGEMSGTYSVLNTDNDFYSVVHGCSSLFKILHYECSWLMSRKQILTPEEEEEFYKKTDKALENYESLNPEEFKKVDQVNCEKEAI